MVKKFGDDNANLLLSAWLYGFTAVGLFTTVGAFPMNAFAST